MARLRAALEAADAELALLRRAASRRPSLVEAIGIARAAAFDCKDSIPAATGYWATLRAMQEDAARAATTE